MRSIRCVSRAAALPFEVIDASRSEEELAREDAQFVAVSQDTRLDARWIDLRTPLLQAAFRVQSAVCQVCAACGAWGRCRAMSAISVHADGELTKRQTVGMAGGGAWASIDNLMMSWVREGYQA